MGKRVFLCLSNCKTNKYRIENFVKYHGGQITVFLEKTVDIIITDVSFERKLPILKQSYLTRSKQLMEMSAKKSGSSSIHQFAKKWHIPVIDCQKIINYCKKLADPPHKPTLCQENMHIRKLKAPYIKVEDCSRMYRPELIEFKSFPFLDTTVPSPNSPFDTWYKYNVNANSVKPKGSPVQFCGLCNEEYREFQVHISSAKHRSAAMDDSNYARIDALIKQGVPLKDFVKSVTEAQKKV